MAAPKYDHRFATRFICSSGAEWTSRAGAFASKYITAAYLGSSVLAMTIATSIASQLFETVNGISRKL